SVLGIPTIPTTRFETACASSHAAFRHAVMDVASGTSDIVLVGGGERVLNVPTADSTEYFAYASDASWEQPLGLTFPGVFALVARAHMAKHGTTEAQMAAVAVKNHKHGTLNPKAQFQKEITLEQVLTSALVADPLKLYDCCPFTDGGAAVVLASEEVAREGRRRRGGREGVDQPRRQDSRESLGWSQGQGPSDRRHRRRPDRRGGHPAASRCRPPPGGWRPRRPHAHAGRQHRHRARVPVRPRVM